MKSENSSCRSAARAVFFLSAILWAIGCSSGTEGTGSLSVQPRFPDHITFARAAAKGFKTQAYDTAATLDTIKVSLRVNGAEVNSASFEAVAREGSLLNIAPGTYDVVVEGLSDGVSMLRDEKKAIRIVAGEMAQGGEFLLAPVNPRAPDITAAPSGYVNQARITVSGAKEMFTGIAVDGETVVAPDELKTFSLSLSFKEGNNRIALTEVTRSGDPGEAASVAVTLDTVAPGVTLFQFASAAVSIPTTELVADVDGASEMLLSANTSFSTAKWGAIESRIPVTLTGSDGMRTLYAKFRDQAGNESPVQSASVQLDRLPPQNPRLTSNFAAAVSDPQITFSATALGAQQVMLSEDFKLQGAQWVALSGAIPFTLSNGQGVKTISGVFRDALGNQSAVTTTTVTLDQVVPSVTQFQLAGAPVMVSSPVVTVDITATDFTALEMLVSANPDFAGSAWEPYAPFKTVVITGGDGAQQIRGQFRDAAGNIKTAATAAFTLDTTAPATPTVSIYGGSVTTEANVTLLLSAGGAPVEMQISDSPVFAGSQWQAMKAYLSFALSGGLGTKTVYARFRDAAGNTSFAASATVTVEDNTPPVLHSVVLASLATETGGWQTPLAVSAGVDAVSMLVTGDTVTPAGWVPYAANSMVSFRRTGYLETRFFGNEGAQDVVIQSDGKIVAAGNTAGFIGSGILVVRMLQDGSPDPTFGTEGLAYINGGTVGAIAVQPDGKILVAGTQSSDPSVYRLLANGALDTGFGTNGRAFRSFGAYTEIADVVVEPDGNILIGGFLQQASAEGLLIRFAPDGSNDATLNGSGYFVAQGALGIGSSGIRSIALQADGKIVAGGYSYNGLDDDFMLARFNLNGTLDASFGSAGVVATDFAAGYDSVFGLLARADGTIVVAGASTVPITSPSMGTVARYSASGTLDTSFGDAGSVRFAGVEMFVGVANAPNGDVIAVGIGMITPTYEMIRLSDTGATVPGFGSGGVSFSLTDPNESPTAVVVQADGSIVITGDGAQLFRVVRTDSQGLLDKTFGTPVGGVMQALVQVRGANGTVSSVLADDILVDVVPPAGGASIVGYGTAVSGPEIYFSVSGEGATAFRASENPLFIGAVWQSMAAPNPFTLSAGDGAKQIGMQFRDASGNVSTMSWLMATLDQTPPNAGVITVQSGLTAVSATSQLFDVYAADAAEMQLSEDILFAAATWIAYSPSTVFDLSAGDGLKTVYVRFRDAAGNASPASSTSVLLDMTLPDAVISAPSMNDTFNSVVAAGSASDSGSGIAFVEVAVYRFLTNTYWDGLAFDGVSPMWTPAVYSTGTWSWSVPASSDGNFAVKVRSIDNAGNISNVYVNNYFIDNTPPLVTTFEILGMPSFISSATVTLNLNVANASWMETSEDEFFAGSTPVSYATSPDFTFAGLDGPQIIWGRFSDAIGNMSIPVTTVTYLDRLAPSGAFIGLTGSPSEVSSSTVGLDLFAVGATEMELSDKGSFIGNWIPYTTSEPFTFVETASTSKTVWVRFRDEAGNVSTPVSTLPFDFKPLKLTSISTSSGAGYASVTISGYGFGGTQGGGLVSIGGASADIVAWSDSSIEIMVPITAIPGDGVFTVSNGVETSNPSSTFTVLMTFGSTSPSLSAAGGTVGLWGGNFGPAGGVVQLGGLPVTVLSWSDTYIEVTVPDTVTAGATNFEIFSAAGPSISLGFMVKPTITGLLSPFATTGQTAVFSGLNLGLVQGASSVTIGGFSATVVAWTAASFSVIVPVMVDGEYPVVVTVGGMNSDSLLVVVAPGFAHPKLQAVALSASAVQLDWDNGQGNLGTSTVLRRAGNGAYSIVASSLGVTTYTDATVYANETFTYQIEMTNGIRTVYSQEVTLPVFVATKVSAGAAHVCALTSAGGVRCWGVNAFGQLGDGTLTDRKVPVDVMGLASGVTQVVAGNAHTCALLVSGGVKCWGAGTNGELGDGFNMSSPVPVDVLGITAATSIATKTDHTCIVDAGTVKCWGNNTFGKLGNFQLASQNFPVAVTSLAPGNLEVGVGSNYSCAVTAGQGVKCWGENSFGQLGNSATASTFAPVDVVGLGSGVAKLGAGHYHACAVMLDGTVQCWGDNGMGTLGDGTSGGQSPIPVSVFGIFSGATEVEADGSHTCAAVGGMMKCWGSGAGGQLGDGSNNDSYNPMMVPTFSTGVNDVAAGQGFSCAVKGQAVKCWGNGGPMVGDGLTITRQDPTLVSELGLSDFTAGENHTCGLTITGGVKCWGNNQYGQLGDGSWVDRLVPGYVGGLTSGVLKVVAGGNHTCAILTSGGVQCWGQNTYGAVGDISTIDRNLPVNVSALSTGVSSIAAGRNHTCAVRAVGDVLCWGGNLSGQLGTGDSAGRLAPVAAGSFTNATLVAAGDSNTCVALGSGGAKCFGLGDYGLIGDGFPITRFNPTVVSSLPEDLIGLSVGAYHACALTSGGDVKCWGDNSMGQVGDGTLFTRYAPVAVTGLPSAAMKLASGPVHSCAVLATGSLYCWGEGASGQLGNGVIGNSLTASAAKGVGIVSSLGLGTNHTCVGTAGGQGICWGSDVFGQLGDQYNYRVPLNVVGFVP